MSLFSKQNLKTAMLFVITILVSDLIFGTLFISKPLRNFFEILTFHNYYNQGFQKDKSGIVKCNDFYPMYYINSMCMKDKCVRDVPQTSSKRRILFLGDSFTEGAEYPYDSTYCGFLTTKIDTAHTEILNAGIRGASPKLFYLRLDYLLNQEQLQVNDVYCPVGYTNIPDELVYQNFQPTLPDMEHGWWYETKLFLVTHSAMTIIYTKVMTKLYCLRNHLHEDQAYFYWVSPDNQFNKETSYDFAEFKMRWATSDYLQRPETAKAISLAEKNLKNIQNLCVAHHIRFHIILYPISLLVYSKPENFEVTLAATRQFTNTMSRFAGNNNIDLINAIPLFTSDRPATAQKNKDLYYIEGDQHWNSMGHKRMADSLYCVINR